MDWLHSDYSHELFERAGVKPEDFVGLRGIAESEFSDRIVVWAQELSSDAPIHKNPPPNLLRVVNVDGLTDYWFAPIT